MSVLARKRSQSKYEFYVNAEKLRRSLLFFLLRDFGIKSRAREVSFYTKKWDTKDRKVLEELTKKYGIAKVIDDYPIWLIERFRNNILRLIDSMIENITTAYSIWATSLHEADIRRGAQDLAIASCENLIRELELAADVLPTKVEKLVPYVDKINKEIGLLKGWRKADNERRRKLAAKENSGIKS